MKPVVKYLLCALLCLGAAHGVARQWSLHEGAASLVPVTDLEARRIAVVGFPSRGEGALLRMARNYAEVASVEPADASEYDLLLFDVKREGMEEFLSFAERNDLSDRSIAVLPFTAKVPRALKRWNVLFIPEESAAARDMAARILFGGHALPGSDAPTVRLDYCSPEEAGVDGAYLTRTIDSLVAAAIERYAFPGCQILVAKDRKVILRRSYGYHTYRNHTPVADDHLYDLASCSKVMGATIAMMKMVEQGHVSLDEPFSKVFPYFVGSNKEQVTLRELLAHQGGLVPSVGVYAMITDSTGALRPGWFSYTRGDEYPIEVYRNMWGRKDLRERIYRAVADTPLGRKKYRYSCMSFLCYPEVIRSLTGMEYPEYLETHFYGPLGARRIMLNPAHKYPLAKIAPTEVDTVYRHALVHGYVHDESAAMLGGVSGNAGLFANADDMAKVLQMLLDGGTYGGRRYLEKETIEEWTSCQYRENGNRRGLGFDKPIWNNSECDIDHSYPAPAVSQRSFGHTGFTGTAFWVDPAEGVIFIFLSNRVHPDRAVDTLGECNTRLTTQQAVYDAIERYRNR